MNMTINITDIETLLRIILHNKTKITLLNEMYTFYGNENEQGYIGIIKIEYIRAKTNPYLITKNIQYLDGNIIETKDSTATFIDAIKLAKNIVLDSFDTDKDLKNEIN